MPRRTSKASGGDDLDSIVHGEQENVPRKVQQEQDQLRGDVWQLTH